MRNGLYPRLAAVNLKKNRQTWLPYLFTCIGTIMMFYIMLTLLSDPALTSMSGGTLLSTTLSFGSIIIALFSVILVFYADSFIIKQRKREFGLYNILGMNKRHIGRVLLWETLYTALIAFVSGIALGILFSKLMQLLLLRILRFDIRFGLYVSPSAIGITALLFAGIFFLTLLNSLRNIHLSKPVELLHGTQEGEREPKSKWILAVFGVLFLGAGYTMAIMTKSAAAAISLFFIAVICVIIGTYLLFTAFSIVFLKRLRANKGYYYKTKHFATVSGMLYRMKKNAGGLASICILSTMVLVTVSTTVCLYMGVDDMLDNMYPSDINVSCYDAETADQRQAAKQTVLDAANGQNRTVRDEQAYQLLDFVTVRSDNSFTASGSAVGNDIMTVASEFKVITAADYNTLLGGNVTLQDGEGLLYTPNYTKNAFSGDSLTLCGRPYRVTMLTSFPLEASVSNFGCETYFLVVRDAGELAALRKAQTAGNGGSVPVYIISFNLDGTDEEKIDCSNAVASALSDDQQGGAQATDSRVACRAQQYQEFVSVYGGLFFLGLFLGFLFLMATVLIIYYKQVTEGYDDRERFRIMQNVGMTKSEVKSTIHSQVLIVFFLPLAACIVHLGFAFPMIRRILQMFSLTNVGLFAGCTLCAIAVFAVLYTLVYVLTAKTYYRIVS